MKVADSIILDAKTVISHLRTAPDIYVHSEVWVKNKK